MRGASVQTKMSKNSDSEPELDWAQERTNEDVLEIDASSMSSQITNTTQESDSSSDSDVMNDTTIDMGAQSQTTELSTALSKFATAMKSPIEENKAQPAEQLIRPAETIEKIIIEKIRSAEPLIRSAEPNDEIRTAEQEIRTAEPKSPTSPTAAPTGPTAAELGPTAAETGPQRQSAHTSPPAAQPGPLVAQSGPLAAQTGPLAAQTDTTEAAEAENKTGDIAGKQLRPRTHAANHFRNLHTGKVTVVGKPIRQSSPKPSEDEEETDKGNKKNKTKKDGKKQDKSKDTPKTRKTPKEANKDAISTESTPQAKNSKAKTGDAPHDKNSKEMPTTKDGTPVAHSSPNDPKTPPVTHSSPGKPEQDNKNGLMTRIIQLNNRVKELENELTEKQLDMERLVDETDHQIRELGNSKHDLEAEKYSLQEERATLQQTLSQILEENNEMRRTVRELEEKHKKLEEEKQTLSSKVREAEDMNSDLLQSLIKTTPAPAPAPTPVMGPRPKVMLVGDSNIHRTKDNLDPNKARWTIVNDVYTTEELIRTLEDKEMTDQLRKQDQIIIHQGTNDIWRERGVGEAKAYQNIIQAVDIIKKSTSATIHLAQIPPITIQDRNDLKIKGAMYNTRLASTKIERVNIIQTATKYKEEKNPVIDKKDGIHLTKTGQDILKDAVEEAITKRPHQGRTNSTTTTERRHKSPEVKRHQTPENRQHQTTTRDRHDHGQHSRRDHDNLNTRPDDADINTTIMETESDAVKHVIGRKGAKVNKLEGEYGARIRVTNSRTAGKSTITIKAPGREAGRAKEAINEIIKAAKEETPDQTCQFYSLGRCKFGNGCRNGHTGRGSKRPRTPSPQRHREPRPRTPSPQRHRDPRPRSVSPRGHRNRRMSPQSQGRPRQHIRTPPRPTQHQQKGKHSKPKFQIME